MNQISKCKSIKVWKGKEDNHFIKTNKMINWIKYKKKHGAGDGVNYLKKTNKFLLMIYVNQVEFIICN